MADAELTLEQEQLAFDAQLDNLMKSHRGQFVLFKNGATVGFYESYEAAYNAGLAQFGLDRPFLISKVELQPPQSVSLAWDAGVMVG